MNYVTDSAPTNGILAGSRLREIRLAKGFTQQQIAEAARTSLDAVRKVERTERAPIRASYARERIQHAILTGKVATPQRTDVQFAKVIDVIAKNPANAIRWVALMESVDSDPARSPKERELARFCSRVVARVAAGADAGTAIRQLAGPGFYEDEGQTP